MVCVIWLYSSLHENKDDELNRLSPSTDRSHTRCIPPLYSLQSIVLHSIQPLQFIHSSIYSTDRVKQVFATILNKYSSSMEDFKPSSNMFFWWRTNNDECINTRIVILLKLFTTTNTTYNDERSLSSILHPMNCHSFITNCNLLFFLVMVD